MNDYLKKWVERIKCCSTDEELSNAVDEIYTEGYEDCANNNKIDL